MKLRLMELRKQAGYRSRDDFAEKLGVNKYTYKSWETGKTMMSLEQAFDVADVLGCSLDELIVQPKPQKRSPYTDPGQEQLNSSYESMNDDGREMLVNVAKSLKKDPDNQPHLSNQSDS